MTQACTAVLIPTLAAALVAAAPTDDTVELRFAPSVGTQTAHTLEAQVHIEGSDLAVVMDGNEVPAQFLPELSFEFKTTSAWTVHHEFLEPRDGIAGAWRKRTIEDASQSFEMSMELGAEAMEFDAEAATSLEGESFLIGRNASGDVVAEWADPESELDAAWLDDARPELDLAGLLPGKPMAAGDTWEADASALADILSATESFPWEWKGTGADGMPGPGETVLEGALELTAGEIRTVDGTTHCTIAIEGQFAETVTRPGDLSQVPVADGTATETTTTQYTVEGELTWNVTAGHLTSFIIEGEGDGEQLTVKDPGQPGPEYRSTTQHTSELKIELK